MTDKAQFEAKIKEYEEHLFGIRLYMKGIRALYSKNEQILKSHESHFKNVVERLEKTILDAKNLSKRIEEQSGDINELDEFKFPPIHGPLLDKLTQRAKHLAKVYDELFPNRPIDKPLRTDELKKIMEAAAESFG
ncbi:hypothetical protein ACFL31_01890 [Candidatus Margulisiibacteriota bacterium]